MKVAKKTRSDIRWNKGGGRRRRWRPRDKTRLHEIGIGESLVYDCFLREARKNQEVLFFGKTKRLFLEPCFVVSLLPATLILEDGDGPKCGSKRSHLHFVPVELNVFFVILTQGAKKSSHDARTCSVGRGLAWSLYTSMRFLQGGLPKIVGFISQSVLHTFLEVDEL